MVALSYGHIFTEDRHKVNRKRLDRSYSMAVFREIWPGFLRSTCYRHTISMQHVSLEKKPRCFQKVLPVCSTKWVIYFDCGDINGIFVRLTVVKTQTEMFVCIRHSQKVWQYRARHLTDENLQYIVKKYTVCLYASFISRN